MLEYLRPNNKQGGNTAQPINKQAASSYPEYAAAYKHTPWHSPTHLRDKSQLYPQWADTSPSYQDACTKPWINLFHQRQEELQTCSLRNGDHKYRKLDKMKQQRDMFQTKEQDRIPEKLSEVEIGNLTEKEFQEVLVKVIQDLRMEAQAKRIEYMFTKELEVLKNR